MQTVNDYKFDSVEQALSYLKMTMDGLAFLVRDMDHIAERLDNDKNECELAAIKLRLQMYRQMFAMLTGTAVSGMHFNNLIDKVRRKDFRSSGDMSKGA